MNLSNGLNEHNRSYFNGSRLKWENSVKVLVNHVRYNLSDIEEKRRKRGNLIGRVNGLLVQYRDAHPAVLMHLRSVFTTVICMAHSVRVFTDPHMLFINTAMQIIWKLHFDSYNVILSSLNIGQNSLGCINTCVIVRMTH